MPKSAIIVLIIGVLGLAIASLFIFRIIDIFPKDQNANRPVSEQGKNMNNNTVKDLKIEDIKTGTGPEVKSGDTISIHYLGTLTDGTKFDSSYDRGAPFETQIGVGRVIEGWDKGVIGMKAGGKRKLTIPANMAYGDQAVGSIPAGSTLLFEVELINIK